MKNIDKFADIITQHIWTNNLKYLIEHFVVLIYIKTSKKIHYNLQIG